ncbi:MAG: RNA polymerase subunit sigma-24 [Verrucomicrobia bacterium]|nr:MAG: RNA polymerase subunit sigma-24 [Verrucomicrobiota bacterium]
MQPLSETVHGLSDPFAPTHWSVIIAAGESQAAPEIARAALAQLCETYWPPLYTFVRSSGHSRHDAQDLTQGFFAYLIEHKIYARADRGKGKFRSFLLASLKNFLRDSRDRDQALKRGGGYDFLSLNEDQIEDAEALLQTHFASGESNGEDRLFERSWAEALVAAGLEHLAAAYRADGKEKLFQELKIFLTGSAEPLPSYADLAARLGTVASTLRSHVTRLRMQYRDALRAEVRRTVETDAEVEGELRELLRVLTTS